MTENLKKYFWLALLAHLLLFLSFSIAFVFEPELQFEKKSERYLPAYLYQKESAAQPATPAMPQTVTAKETPPEPQKLSPDTIALKKEEPQQQKVQTAHPKTRSSAAFMQAESLKSGKPIDEPLLKELSRATAAKLFYPNEAAAYGIRGMATIS